MACLAFVLVMPSRIRQVSGADSLGVERQPLKNDPFYHAMFVRTEFGTGGAGTARAQNLFHDQRVTKFRKRFSVASGERACGLEIRNGAKQTEARCASS